MPVAPPVVCLAGADAAYAAWGAELAAALRAAGARWVVLAGKTVDFEVDDTCAMGVDALDFLTRDEGEAGMSTVPESFAGLPLVGDRGPETAAQPPADRRRPARRGSRPRASRCCRSTAPSTSRASTRWTPGRA